MAAEAPAETPARESLAAHLKASTVHLHRRIEEVVPLMRPGFGRPAYRAYLSRLLAFHRPLEDRLGRYDWEGWGLEFSTRRRAALLERDLRVLGESAAHLESLAPCPLLPGAASLAEAWGCLYVLEGSTLGGQFLLRALAPRLQLSAAHGLSFLAGHGEHTGSAWRAFTAALTHFDDQGCDRAAVVRGACETFATQLDWLSAEPGLG